MTHSIMANIIGQVQKLRKHKTDQPDMNFNILTVPVSISFYHNTYDKNIYMTLNLSSANNIPSTITAAVREKPADTIEK